jgi:hypothetical protein
MLTFSYQVFPALQTSGLAVLDGVFGNHTRSAQTITAVEFVLPTNLCKSGQPVTLMSALGGTSTQPDASTPTWRLTFASPVTLNPGDVIEVKAKFTVADAAAQAIFTVRAFNGATKLLDQSPGVTVFSEGMPTAELVVTPGTLELSPSQPSGDAWISWVVSPGPDLQKLQLTATPDGQPAVTIPTTTPDGQLICQGGVSRTVSSTTSFQLYVDRQTGSVERNQQVSVSSTAPSIVGIYLGGVNPPLPQLELAKSGGITVHFDYQLANVWPGTQLNLGIMSGSNQVVPHSTYDVSGTGTVTATVDATFSPQDLTSDELTLAFSLTYSVSGSTYNVPGPLPLHVIVPKGSILACSNFGIYPNGNLDINVVGWMAPSLTLMGPFIASTWTNASAVAAPNSGAAPVVSFSFDTAKQKDWTSWFSSAPNAVPCPTVSYSLACTGPRSTVTTVASLDDQYRVILGVLNPVASFDTPKTTLIAWLSAALAVDPSKLAGKSDADLVDFGLVALIMFKLINAQDPTVDFQSLQKAAQADTAGQLLDSWYNRLGCELGRDRPTQRMLELAAAVNLHSFVWGAEDLDLIAKGFGLGSPFTFQQPAWRSLPSADQPFALTVKTGDGNYAYYVPQERRSGTKLELVYGGSNDAMAAFVRIPYGGPWNAGYYFVHLATGLVLYANGTSDTDYVTLETVDKLKISPQNGVFFKSGDGTPFRYWSQAYSDPDNNNFLYLNPRGGRSLNNCMILWGNDDDDDMVDWPYPLNLPAGF